MAHKPQDGYRRVRKAGAATVEYALGVGFILIACSALFLLVEAIQPYLLLALQYAAYGLLLFGLGMVLPAIHWIYQYVGDR